MGALNHPIIMSKIKLKTIRIVVGRFEALQPFPPSKILTFHFLCYSSVNNHCGGSRSPYCNPKEKLQSGLQWAALNLYNPYQQPTVHICITFLVKQKTVGTAGYHYYNTRKRKSTGRGLQYGNSGLRSSIQLQLYKHF